MWQSLVVLATILLGFSIMEIVVTGVYYPEQAKPAATYFEGKKVFSMNN